MTTFQASHPVNWTVIGANADLPSVMLWTSEDPLAVRIDFGGEGVSTPTSWLFARDLLADVVSGRSNRTGEGDVLVERLVNHGLDGPSRDQLVLTLSCGNVVSLRTDLSEIKIFLDSTYIYAPQGGEVVDMDSTIDKLLDGGWASGV